MSLAFAIIIKYNLYCKDISGMCHTEPDAESLKSDKHIQQMKWMLATEILLYIGGIMKWKLRKNALIVEMKNL